MHVLAEDDWSASLATRLKDLVPNVTIVHVSWYTFCQSIKAGWGRHRISFGQIGKGSMNGNRSRLELDLEVLFDPSEPTADHDIDVTDAATINDVQIRLARYFGESAGHAVVLTAAGRRLGVVSRKSFGLAGQTAGDPGGYEVGGGDRLMLPGFSTRYKLLRFHCRQCAAEPEYRIFYDLRDLPDCPQGHGRMELAQ